MPTTPAERIIQRNALRQLCQLAGHSWDAIRDRVVVVVCVGGILLLHTLTVRWDREADLAAQSRQAAQTTCNGDTK